MPRRGCSRPSGRNSEKSAFGRSGRPDVFCVGFWDGTAHLCSEDILLTLTMNDRRKREEALFDEAQGLTDLVQRKAFLDAACAADPDLRRRLEELLVDAADADKFFEASGAA